MAVKTKAMRKLFDQFSDDSGTIAKADLMRIATAQLINKPFEVGSQNSQSTLAAGSPFVLRLSFTQTLSPTTLCLPRPHCRRSCNALGPLGHMYARCRSSRPLMASLDAHTRATY